jgi:hypothetical protein
MDQLILFPDAEGMLISHLKASFASRGETAKVSSRTAPDAAGKYVRVSRVGGPASLVTDNPMLTVQTWGASTLEASNLGKLARALVRTMPGLKSFREIGGLQYFEDPDSTQPRYQFTVQVSLRGVTEG